jgi:Ca-activated chloride channel family protein
MSSLTLSFAPAAAQGWIEQPRGGVEKVRSAVQVSVIGRVAHVSVEEWFRNAGPRLDEGSYLYPLPGEAVFADFSLWQGDRELKGEPMDAAQARSIYEDIVRRKRDPALIELAGHGLLRARVFPIAPGETRKITLRYTQMLDRVGDAWRFRYVGGSGPGVAGSRSLRVQVDSADRFGEPYSPTHRITSSRSGDRREITLADPGARGDFELFLPLARALVGMSLVTSQPVGEDGFFMLLLAPGNGAQVSAQRRDLVAVLDVSGSMSGDKLDQARTALVQLLGTLRANDRFRVIAFGSGVRRYADGWTPASTENLRVAQDWVRHLDADGGTNIAGALTEALTEPPAERSTRGGRVSDGRLADGRGDGPRAHRRAGGARSWCLPRVCVRRGVRREHIPARPPHGTGPRRHRVYPARGRHRAGGGRARGQARVAGAHRSGALGGWRRAVRPPAARPARSLRRRRAGRVRPHAR